MQLAPVHGLGMQELGRKSPPTTFLGEVEKPQNGCGRPHEGADIKLKKGKYNKNRYSWNDKKC